MSDVLLDIQQDEYLVKSLMGRASRSELQPMTLLSFLPLSPLLLCHPQQLPELGLTKHPFVWNEHIKAFTEVCTRMYTDKLCRPC